jgi:hypothetical protein
MRLYLPKEIQHLENLPTTNKQQTHCQKITKQTKSNTSKYNNNNRLPTNHVRITNKPQNEKYKMSTKIKISQTMSKLKYQSQTQTLITTTTTQ